LVVQGCKSAQSGSKGNGRESKAIPSGRNSKNIIDGPTRVIVDAVVVSMCPPQIDLVLKITVESKFNNNIL
jgi:hypothetical protein